jgi:hypothetical protein
VQRLDPSLLLRQRSLEGYLKAGGRPRWMERVMEVDRRTARETARLREAYGELREACGDDAEAFAERWRERLRTWDWDPGLNVLIEQHNAWYPIERDLPMDPRTGDYIRVHGRSYRRPVLDAAWALEHFPAG